MKRIKPVGTFSRIHLLFGFLSCLAVYYAFLGRVGEDEIEAVHTAWKILNGEAIYRDFFQHHHPLFYYLLLPLIKFGGETIVTFYLAEAFAFLIFAGTVVTTFFLAEKIYGDRKTSWFSVILLLTFPFFITAGTDVRPDGLQVLLGLAAVYFLVVYLSEGGRKRLILSALLLSLSFLALQKAVFLILVVGLFLLYCLFKAGQKSEYPKITKKDFFLYWAVFFAAPALYAVFLLATGDWQNYFDFNWLVNMKYLSQFSLLIYFTLDISGQAIWGHNYYLLTTLGMAGFVLLFICGLGYFFRIGGGDGTDKTGGGLRGFAVSAGGVLGASVFLVRAPSPHYFLAAAPFISMVAAFSLRRLFTGSAATAGLLIFTLLCSAYLLLNTKLSSAKTGKVSEMEYILSVSGPEDVYFGHSLNLFRKDTSFFWFCMEPKECVDTYRSFRDYDFFPVQAIKETRPKVIHAAYPHSANWKNFYMPIMKHPDIAPDYKRSQKYRWIYVRKNGR